MDYNEKLTRLAEAIEVSNKKAQWALEKFESNPAYVPQLENARAHMRDVSRLTRTALRTIEKQESFLYNRLMKEEGLTS